MIRLCPVMCFANGDTRKMAALAISSELAGQPNGVISDHVFSYALSDSVLSVKVAPGAIVLMRLL